MNAKERMFHSIENAIKDVTAMQDVVIKLTREIHELHVTKEHEAKLGMMKEQADELKKRMDALQEFLYACERPTEFKERRLSEIDVAS
jgi:Trm5-related predicted tRNA methylase